MTYTSKDFPGFVLHENWTLFDFLEAVVIEYYKENFPEKYKKYLWSRRRAKQEFKNGKQKVKGKSLRIKENTVKNEKLKRNDKLVPVYGKEKVVHVNEKLKGKEKLVPDKKDVVDEDCSDDWGEGCSRWYEDCDSNERKSLKKKKRDQENTKKKEKVKEQLGKSRKRLKKVSPISNPELPEEFKDAIRELNGGTEYTGEMMLVMAKVLTVTDANTNQFRMLLNRVDETDFTGLLSEKDNIRLTELKELCTPMKVNIIEPTLEHGAVELRIYNMKKSYYALAGGQWKSMLKRHELKEGTEVHLWGFRIGEDLWFALCKMPPRED